MKKKPEAFFPKGIGFKVGCKCKLIEQKGAEEVSAHKTLSIPGLCWPSVGCIPA